MSNALAIAAVSRTLRNLLEPVTTADYDDLPEDARPTAQIEITTLPPDRVRVNDSARNRLNLFCYLTELNPAWRSMDVPGMVRTGENGHAPLAVNLHYLLTAYGEGDNELIAHVLLGSAMSLLHDHPVLGRAEIRAAFELSELDGQVERVRITPEPVSFDQLSNLWTGLQSEYRLSAGYEAAVVLIDSRLPTTAALPVLRRGAGDRGPHVVAGPTPTLLGITGFAEANGDGGARVAKPAAELGDLLIIEVTDLGSETMAARLRHDLVDLPFDRPLLPGDSPTQVRITIPPASDAGVAAGWPAGVWTVELRTQRPASPNWTTNRLPFGLAPTITGLDPVEQEVGTQPFDLTVTCTPQVRPEQRVVLLIDAREVVPTQVTTPAQPNDDTTVVFTVDGLDIGAHVVRLRVDGVDSIPIDPMAVPPRFDPAQTLTVTP